MEKPLKMYILIKEDVPDQMVPVISAHASLASYLRFSFDEKMKEWLASSFRKVVCKVNNKEFENAKKFDGVVVLTESALDGREVCVVTTPTNEDKPFKFYKLWKPFLNY